MKKVFVSGCYDILHAGHLQFFEEARALGDYLIVSFASAEVLWHHKRRKPSIPDEHKQALLLGLRMIDEVIITHGHKEGLDFEDDFLRIQPDFLIVTEDDKYGQAKHELCAKVGARYTILPKTPPKFAPVSTSSIVRWVQAPTEAPLRTLSPSRMTVNRPCWWRTRSAALAMVDLPEPERPQSQTTMPRWPRSCSLSERERKR